MSKVILNSLAQRLQSGAKGNCSYDPTCSFGLGQECTAGQSFIYKKFEEMKAQFYEENDSGLFAASSPDNLPWPCASCAHVFFKDPE